MYIKKLFSGIMLILMLALPVTVLVHNITFNTIDSLKSNVASTNDNGAGSKSPVLDTIPIHKSLNKQLDTKLGNIDSIVSKQGITWTKPPGNWWDTSWGYRINVTITNDEYDRNNWPVTVHINFNPVAYKYSIRVVDDNNQEIPSQLSDVSYYNSTHIASANVTFLLTLNAFESANYSIYWRTKYTDPPTYTKNLYITEEETPAGTKYIISSVDGWSIVLPPDNGGLPSNITHQIGSDIGHGTNIHFGVTVNGSIAYDDYWGVANTTVSYQDRYIPGYSDPMLRGYYLGVVFIPYKIINSELRTSSSTLAYVNYTYVFYSFGFEVSESILWNTNVHETKLYYSGWVFDQDDGDQDYNFDKIYTPTQLYDISVPKYSTISGSVTVPYDGPNNNRRIYNTGNDLSSIAVLRVYLTAGPHTIKIIPAGNTNGLGPDDWAARVADTDGNWMMIDDIIAASYGTEGTHYGLGDYNYLVWSYGPWVSFNITASTDGYYFIYMESFDDDGNDGEPDRTQFTCEVDGSLLGQVYVYTSSYREIAYGSKDPTDDGYVYLRNSIELKDLYVDSEALGIDYTLTLSWSSSDDLDFIVYDPGSAIMGYNISSTANPEKIVFVPSIAGHYTILVHKYSGSSYSTSYDIEVEVMGGPEWSDFDETGNWNWFAIYHSTRSIGVGLVKLSETISVSSYGSANYIIHNEGNDSDIDYIYFAREIGGVYTNPSEAMVGKYFMILWEPTGATDAERYQTFNYYKDRLQSSPSSTLSPDVEKFNITVQINVINKDNAAVESAVVKIYNGTNLLYQLETDENGKCTAELIRYSYRIEVYINSLNETYSKIVNVDYSTYNYTVHSNTTSIQFSNLVKFMLHAESNTSTPYDVQHGEVLLIKNSSYSLYGLTNLTGWVVAHIESGTWTLKFNKSVTSPEDWDAFYLFNDSSKSQVIGTPTYTEISISLDADKDYWLVDYDLKGEKTPTELVLYNTPSSFTVTWLENVSITVILRQSTDKTAIDGTIYWYIFDSEDNLIHSDSGATSSGLYSFEFNTSILKGGLTYFVHINATPTDTATYLYPTPLNVPVNVKERATRMEIKYKPSFVIDWNETIVIEVYYKDSEKDYIIKDANVKLKLISGNFSKEFQLSFVNDHYELRIDNFYYDAGVYTIYATAKKENYTSIELTDQIIVNERPTILYGPDVISIPWQDNYTLTIQYNDFKTSSPIIDADVKAEIIDPDTNNVIDTISLSYQHGYYSGLIDINGLGLTETSYIILVSAGKSNYDNQTKTITFSLAERRTHIDAFTTHLTVIWGSYINISFTYIDDDFDEYIPFAIKKMYSIVKVGLETGIVGQLISLNNGTYSLSINSSELGIGTYTAHITIKANHYNLAEKTVSIVVNPIPTIAVTSKTHEEIEWGLSTQIIIWFNDSRTGHRIPAPDNAYYTIQNETSLLGPYDLIFDPNNGYWILLINTTSQHLSPGIYTINVTLTKTYYTNRTIIITLNIKEIGTYAYAQPANVTLYWGEEAEIKVFYNMTREKTFINATATYIVKDLDNGTTIEIEGLIQTKDGYYLVQLDSSLLTDGHRYVITITFTKTYYVSATVTIYVKVLPIPVSTSVTPPITDLTWGDDFNFTLVLINTLDQTYLTDVSITLLVLVEGEMVNVGNAITYMTANNTFIITVKSGLLNTSAYTIRLIITKVHYDIPNVEMVARIHPVEITVTMRTEKTVFKNPVTSTATTTVEITLIEAGTGTPVTGATLTILVMRGETEILRVTAVESEYYPGVYVAKIDWTNIEPGDYTLRAVINSIQRGGYETSEANIISATGTVELGTSVDYLGGSTVIAGKPYPNLLVYPVIIATFIAVGFVSYRYYAWIKLPVEVRELINLIKAIQKNIFEYESPPREEVFKDVLRKQLALE